MKDTFLIFILIFIFIISCNNGSNKIIDSGDSQTINQDCTSVLCVDTSQYIKPFRTESGMNYSFWRIDSMKYKVLKRNIKIKELPNDDYTDFATVNDSSIIIKFRDGHIDTLEDGLDKNGVDYTFKNYSKNNKYFIISYFDSEAVFFNLFNLNVGGKSYGLYDNQKLSPNGKTLISYANKFDNPFTNYGLFFLRFYDQKTIIDLDLSDMDWEVMEFDWLNDNNAILKLEEHNNETYKLENREYCLMKIE